MSETAESSWLEDVKQVIAGRAYVLNYDDGMQCRFMPVKTEEGRHTIEVLMEMTHSGHPFDLRWFVRCGDDSFTPIEFEIVAPEGEGGVLWHTEHRSLDQLRHDAQVLPVFIRGYFVGRSAALASLGASAAAAATGPTTPT
jgi:hypothetical protein